MRKITIFLTALLMGNPLWAQQISPELKELVSTVVTLRQSDANKQRIAFDKVKAALAQNKLWTPMDELVDSGDGECRVTDPSVRWFRLNPILNGIMQQREGLTAARGDFLNGEDARFNYSLIEKGVKAKSKVTYTFKGRQGAQDFVVVPFKAGQAKLIVRLYRQSDGADKPLAECRRASADGNYYLTSDAPLKAEDILVLEIANQGASSMTMVILNHNKRQ